MSILTGNLFLRYILLAGIAAIVISCSSNPYRKINRDHQKAVKERTALIKEIPKTKTELENDTLSISDEWVGTTNFSIRKPNFVIIHHTAQDSVKQTITTFTLSRTQVSSHYVIGRNGEVVQMLNDYLRSWHAGAGKWGNDTDLNSSSIGIELDNNGFEPFTEKQIESLLIVLKRLKWTYNIPTANFIGHSDIAPSRKTDPSRLFPWKKLASEGFGLWYDEEVILAKAIPIDSLSSFSLAQPEYVFEEYFNPLEALRIIGYDIKNPEAAIQAFKLHFVQTDVSPQLTDYDCAILYNLYKKYL